MRTKLVGRRVVFAILGAVLAVAALEITLRLIAYLLDNSVRAGEGERTILCVGDSWTHGLGMSSYGEELEKLLDVAAGDAARFRVVRSGVPGCNSSQGLHRLQRLAPEIRPDVVIVLLGNNDHQNLAESEYWRFRTGEMGRVDVLGARARAVLHGMRTFKLARTAWLAVRGRPTLDVYFTGEGFDVPSKDVAIDLETHRRQLRFNLTRIVELSREYEFDLVFMTYFYFHAYQVNEDILDVAYAHGIPVVNLTIAFHERILEAERDTYYRGAHPTEAGNRFIAERILEVLREGDLVDLGRGSGRGAD